MTKQEKLARAFGRGLAEGLVGSNGAEDTPPSQQLPPVVPMESIKEAVRQVVQEIIAADESAGAPGEQTDLFDIPPDPMADAILQRVQEARERANANENEPPPGTHDPDAPGSSSTWSGPTS